MTRILNVKINLTQGFGESKRGRAQRLHLAQKCVVGLGCENGRWDGWINGGVGSYCNF